MSRAPRRPHPASSSRPGAVPMSQRHLPPASAPAPLSTVSRRTLLAASAATVPVGAAVLSAAPALADPSVTDGETRLVDVPLVEVPLVEVDSAQARDLADQPATMADRKSVV